MKWNIVTDSSCDLHPLAGQTGDVQISSVPFIISVGDKDFVDDSKLDTAAMLKAMEQCPQASHTSCPSPQGWVEQFEQAEQSIAFTISAELSGSFSSAMIAKEIVLEKYPDRKIAVLDSCSTGPEIALCVEETARLIESGANFENIVAHAKAFFQKSRVAFALSSFDNLVKNGRMSKIAGFIARKLGMWGIGIGSDEGTIAIKGKTRGVSGALSMLLDDMKEHGFCGGKVMISHCHNHDFAEKLKLKIQERWENCVVDILPTRGLCSYYAERGGLILAY